MVGFVVAGVAHLAAAPDHLDWWPASGWFFIAMGVWQLALAVHLSVRRVRPQLAFWALLGTAGIVTVYVTSRTIGIPGTPPVPLHGARWVPGRAIMPNGTRLIGPLDVLTLAAELATGAALFVRLPPQLRSRAANGLMVGGVALWAGVVIGAQ